jgi:hypothetical protein
MQIKKTNIINADKQTNTLNADKPKKF